MMNYRLALTFAAALAVASCSSSPDESRVPLTEAEAMYQQAQEQMASGSLTSARVTLEDFLTRYPFGPYAEQVQLDLIYLTYKLDDIQKALANIDRFLRLNPNHRDIDYVMYMRGMVNQRAEYSAIQEMVGVDRSDRDPSFAKQAFEDFSNLLREFPESKYAADAKQRMVWLKSRLAQYELAVAQYYMKREAYLAAANRGRYVLEYFSNTPEVEAALAIMVESYDQMGLDDLREQARATLRKNYPNNSLANANN
ncbi:MAG: outer membrane protein assembly factor BamD [Idiomarina sp.]